MNADYKKHGLILLGVIVVICIASFTVFRGGNEKEQVVKGKETQMDVYLLHDDMLIRYPTITDVKKSSDKIKEIIHYLGQSASSFKAILKEDTQLNQVIVKDKVATLDFNKLNYDRDLERKLLESLIFSCTQFDDIEQIKIQVDSKELSNLPLNNTPLLNTTRNFGINHVDTNQIYLHKGNETILFYQRDIEGKMYDVPRSIRLNHTDDYNEIMNVILSVPNGSSQLTQPLADKNIVMEKEARFEDGTLHLYLNKNILATNEKLEPNCVAILKRDFNEFEAIRTLEIHVDKKTYDVIVKK